MPSASVIVVNHNGGTRVVANLRAILAQATGLGAELVVVDNASLDGSPERILEELPGVRLVRERENGGYARGANTGVALARGAVRIIMNSDVVPREGALARLARAVRERREFGILGGVVVGRSGRPDRHCFRALPRPGDIVREGLFLPPRQRRSRAPRGADARVVEVDAVSGSVMAIGEEALAALGPMDGSFFLYNEDVEWCRRAARKGFKVGVVADAVFEHEGGAATRRSEGPAFAARVLSDFVYFCEGEGVSPTLIRRLWRIRVTLRAWFYGAWALFGAGPGGRVATRRAAIYRLIGGALRGFAWSARGTAQAGHPSRLIDLPEAVSRRDGDARPTVLQVTPNMDYGGSQRIIESLVTGPLARSYRFEILCLTHVGPVGERLRRHGVPVHLAGMSRWTSPREWRRSADVAAILDPDLVHAHLLPADVAAWLGFRGRAPIVSTKHGVDEDLPGWARLVEWFVLRCADDVLAVSDAVASAKSCLGRDGMLPGVVPSPPMVPMTDLPRPLLEEGRKARLAMVGRLHPVKRVDLFLRAAAMLERARPGAFEYSIVGEGREEAALRSLAHELGVGGIVRFRGAVPDVAAELDEADVVLLLSDHEGLGLVVIEALARGRIPIVRRAAGAEEALPGALEDCLVASSNPDDVAAKVLEVVDSRERCARLVAEGRAWLARRADHAPLMKGVYDRALLRGRPGGRVRVVYIITRLIVGGAQETAIDSVARLDPERYESHLWAGPQTGAEGSLRDDARAKGILVRILPNMVREVNPWKDLLVTLRLVRLLRRGRFDIVHTHCSKAGIVGRIAARLAGVSHIVHTAHGWGFHGRTGAAARAFYVGLERMMERWTRPIVAVSERTIRIGIESGIGRPGSYRLIRSGIPLSKFFPDAEARARVRAALGVAKGELLVGSVGRLSTQKNPLDFVRVAERLLRRSPSCRFLYVGDGPLRSVTEQAITDAGIRDRVLLPGVRDDVPDLLRAMDVMVMTSLWEGLPRVVLQALATGVPVVSYDVTGIDECVIDGRNGYLVPTGGVDDMVERLGRLADDAALCADMGRRAREGLTEAFSEDAMILDLERLYRDIMSGGLDAHDAGG